MIPSVLTGQIRRGVEDFLQTTFPPSNRFFHGLLDRLIARDGGLFRGPYLSVKLPFRQGVTKTNFFPDLPVDFAPFLHQEKAFQRLTGKAARSTIISTGTGSGKTESFLYPVLDYCRQNRGKQGIKAILIYPMNALATDQAKRLAKIIWSNPNLKDHVTAGLFIGGDEDSPTMAMSADKLITNRDTMRLTPPDILLTNYKMLDYLMIRPKDFPIWKQNEPETLRYLVVDELHTFDGAQGTDLACLIRRLKARLQTPKDYLCCIGTSATLGGQGDVSELRQYAAKVFGEEFEEDSVITETLLTPSEFFGDANVSHTTLPGPERGQALSSDSYANDREYITAQVGLWFGKKVPDYGSAEWRLTLAKDLIEHEFMRKLLQLLKKSATPQAELLADMEKVLPGFSNTSEEYKRDLLNSFLALISVARRKNQERLFPFLQVRSQLWLRELRRLVADVRLEPNLYFSDDLKEDQLKRHLAVVHCRECGAIGWGGHKREVDANLIADLQQFYMRFFSNNPTVHFVFPREDGIQWKSEQQEFTTLICGHCLHLTDGDQVPSCPGCGAADRLIPVLVSSPRSTQGNTTRGSHDCPYCKGVNSLTILGSRAASLTSVVISQLYSSTFNDDKKLLTFSDSVQDASHRAGFFAARTFRFNLRSALQKFMLSESGPLLLSEVGDKFVAYWLKQWGEARFIASFLPPDLSWLEDYEFLKENGNLPPGSKLFDDLRRRISWEITSEYGFNCRIGRTLEKTGCSIASLDLKKLQQVAAKLLEPLQNEIGGLRGLDAPGIERLLVGLLCQMKGNGGIEHPVLAGYLKNWGNTFALNKTAPYMPYFITRMRIPQFLTKKRDTRFEKLIGLASNRTWYQQWLEKNLSALNADIGQFAEPIFDKVLPALVEAGLLVQHESEGFPIWAINPGAMHVSVAPMQYRCAKCGHNMSGSKDAAGIWAGMICLRFNCIGTYVQESVREDYYGKLYSTGDIERLFAEEHTGLLDRKTRDDIERRFKRAPSERQPADPNLLSCTPTLEMGIDIGDLSSIVLCSVPPGQANYLQRVGRAGRKDGNSLAVTLANGNPHDLYFFAKPEEMLAGRVDPPGCFLDAPAVLERQFTAFCFDRWVESGIAATSLPLKIGAVLSNLDKPDRKEIFPYNFLLFIENKRTVFLTNFVKMFEPALQPASIKYLEDFASGGSTDERSLAYKITDRMHGLLREQKSLKKRLQNLTKAIKEKKESPLKDQNFEEDLDHLESEKDSLNAIISKINEKDTFNFFTDEGLLPNYSFPEAGVLLRSIILRKKAAADQHGRFRSQVFEYERPAATAISELAPANSFYAEGRLVEIDQIDMSLSPIEEWRFCKECSHHERVVTGSDTKSCPQCHNTLWSDEAQKRPMVRMRQVVATTYDRESRSYDDSDDREPTFYSRQLLVDFDGKFITAAYELDKPDFPFGFEFLSKVSFREINFGQQGSNSEEVTIAGVPMPKIGFVICSECGKVYNTSKPFQHAISCRYRNSKSDKPIEDCLYLYREFASEAIRILLPVLSLAEDQRLHSFIAALYLGLKKKFRGNIDHLRTAIHEEPIPNSNLRKRFLVLYDVVPGGTGYLKELMRPPLPLMEVFWLAREILRSCDCAKAEDKDGCYRCLYVYRQSRERANISRKVALDFLSALLDSSPALKETDTISNIAVNSLLESELEVRFVEGLRRSKHTDQKLQLKPHIVNGKPGWRVVVASRAWLIEPQVQLGPAQGIALAARADFVFYPERSSDSFPVAVFVDGFAFHAEGDNHRVGKDMAQRMAIARSGKFHAWSLSWNDVENVFVPLPENSTENILNTNVAGLGPLLAAREVTWMRGFHELKTFPLFIEFLARPERKAWMRYAEVHSISFPSKALLDQKTAERVRAAATSKSGTLPVIAGDAGEFFSAWYERVDESGVRLLQVCTIAPKIVVQKGDVDEFAFIARLFDAEPQCSNPRFRGAWGGFLRVFNVFQFLPRAYFVTSRGLENNEYQGFDEALWTRSNSEGGVGTAAVTELLTLTTPETHALLREIAGKNLPLPEPGYELEGANKEIVATAELAWPKLAVAILMNHEAAQAAAFDAQGWKTLHLVDVLADSELIVSVLKSKR